MLPDLADGVDWPYMVQIIVAYGMCLAFLAAYHILIARGKPGDWFEVHAVANAVVVVLSIPAMIVWLSDPLTVVSEGNFTPPAPLGPGWTSLDVLFHPNTNWAILMIDAVHTYHCLGWKLSAQDIYHHALFVPALGLYGGFFVKWGPIRNCVAFFISGLPGGIDYVILVLVKRGYVSKFMQKRVSAKINLMCRGPGVGVLLPATCYLSWLYHDISFYEMCQLVFIGVFCCYNGLYYMDMSIRNYQMHLTTAAINEKHMKEMAAVQGKLDEAYWVGKEQGSRQKLGVSITKSFTGDWDKTSFASELLHKRGVEPKKAI